jgi:S-adenosylmethionine:tRNA ribosyltransferase-isomerase
MNAFSPVTHPDSGRFSQPASAPADAFPLDFALTPELEAGEPPEARGLSRDQVRMLVSYLGDDRIVHTRFYNLPEYLENGDLLVINTSGTMNAALQVARQDGTPLELHLSTRLPSGRWVIELRLPGKTGTQPFFSADAGEVLRLPAGGQAQLCAPYRPEQIHRSSSNERRVRLWEADLRLPRPVQTYLQAYGFPIRYKYVREQWPLAYYQSVYATERGSAEMPSAGRAFTQALLERLKTAGVLVAPLILHTGVASLEDHEPPYQEYYLVPEETAQAVNHARATGSKVIAVGTTVVRALETVTGDNGLTRAGEGWTDLVITPQHGLRAITGLLTGLHEPRSTHLYMLTALAGDAHIRKAYRQALANGYLWHEFGDMHLILPGEPSGQEAKSKS